MVKVSVLYANGDGKTFDVDYWLNTHIPMAREAFGPACKGTSADVGLAGGAPGAPAAYVAMAHFLFDSVEAFQGAMAPNAEQLMGDIPNYTNIQPTILISEVKV